VAGQPLLGHVIGVLDRLGIGRTIVVIGYQADRVRAAFAEAEVEWATQSEQRGTGHAAQMAGPALEGFEGTLLVVCGDTPLLTPKTLHDLLVTHRDSGAAVTVLSMRLPDPTNYGRIVRTENGDLEAIVEHRDATAEQRRIDEVNSGIYVFHYPALVDALAGLNAHNAQGEFYLTDTVALIRRTGRRAAAMCASDYRELLGINTVEELAEAERIYESVRGPERGGR
jgi:UDP-N-acetylglucosamine diphosphorylase/glucosamine-1-phosphate N-acetyltransferase